MANWYGTSRTNYVKVISLEAAEAFAKTRTLEVDPHPTEVNFVMFTSTDESGGFNHWQYDPVAEEITDCWSWEEVAEILVEGQVLIVMEIGAEKLRYLTGSAIAVTWDGRTAYMTLENIYQKAAEEFGVPSRSIAHCSYQYMALDYVKETKNV